MASPLLKKSGTLFFLLFSILIPSALPAQAAEPFSGWKKVTTEHFIIIYEERDSDAAAELLTFCEDVYNDVTGFFGYEPERIRCILRGRIDSANGYYSNMPDRINLYITPPSAPWMGARTENWLKVLLTHELTHYVHMTYDRGFMRVVGAVFGKDLRAFDSAFMPGWMVEGIPIYLETKFSEGGRGRNPFFELYWKAASTERDLWSLRRSSYSTPFPPPGRHYVAGHMIIDYMTERFGEDVILRIHRRFKKFPFFGPRRAIRSVTGVPARDIYRDMVTELYQKHAPDPAIPGGTRISPEVTGNYYFPRFTGEGVYVYRTRPDTPAGLVLFDPETGTEKKILQASLTDSDSWTVSRSGDVIVFSSLEGRNAHPSGSVTLSDLYIRNRNSGKTRRLTTGAHLQQPALSPDGSRLAAVRMEGSYGRLVEVDRETGEMSVLFDPGNAMLYTPVFSDDNRRILFALNREGVQDIWLYDDAEGKAAPLYTPDVHGEYYPRFLDDETVIFCSDREGDLRLYTFSLEDRQLRLLQRDPVGAYIGEVYEGILYYGSYSPDGWCIKTVNPAPDSPGSEDIQLPPPPAAPAVRPPRLETQPAIAEAKRYGDFPAPLVWAPLPIYMNTLVSGFPRLGLGIFSMGISPLQRSQWYAAVTSRTDIFQPGILLEALIPAGPVEFTYTYEQAYYEAGESAFYQSLSQALRITVPLYSRSSYSRFLGVSLFTGAFHTFTLANSTPFSFINSFTAAGMESRHALFATGGAGIAVQRYGSFRDIYAPLLFRASAQVNVPLPVTDYAASGFSGYNTLEFQFPSPIRHHFFRLGIKNNYTTPELRSSRRVTPRGLFDAEAQPEEGTSLLALDYLMSLAVMDAPLPLGDNMFGLHLEGIGLGIHGEMLLDWSITSPSAALDNYIYTGVEMVFLAGSRSGTVPITLGLTFRFDRTLTAPVQLTKDLRPYLYISLDSFISSARTDSGAPQYAGTLSGDSRERNNR